MINDFPLPRYEQNRTQSKFFSFFLSFYKADEKGTHK